MGHWPKNSKKRELAACECATVHELRRRGGCERAPCAWQRGCTTNRVVPLRCAKSTARHRTTGSGCQWASGSPSRGRWPVPSQTRCPPDYRLSVGAEWQLSGRTGQGHGKGNILLRQGQHSVARARNSSRTSKQSMRRQDWYGQVFYDTVLTLLNVINPKTKIQQCVTLRYKYTVAKPQIRNQVGIWRQENKNYNTFLFYFTPHEHRHITQHAGRRPRWGNELSAQETTLTLVDAFTSQPWDI
jgi:hypothetical protein